MYFSYQLLGTSLHTQIEVRFLQFLDFGLQAGYVFITQISSFHVSFLLIKRQAGG